MSKSIIDKKKFEELYLSYSKDLFWIAMAYSNNRPLAEDAVQEAFLYVWKNKKNLQDEGKIRAYLNHIVRNYIIDYFRHIKVKEKHAPQIKEDILERQSDVLDEEWNEKIKIATELINSLPEACRKIFVMAVIEGMKYKDVANQLDISINTVKMQMKIAYKKIQSAAPKQYILIIILLKSQIFTPHL